MTTPALGRPESALRGKRAVPTLPGNTARSSIYAMHNVHIRTICRDACGQQRSDRLRNARAVPRPSRCSAVKVLAFQTDLAARDAAPLAKKATSVRYRFVVPQVSGVQGFRAADVYACRSQAKLTRPGPAAYSACTSSLCERCEGHGAVQYVTHYGQELRVVGSLPELGGWNPWTAPRMSWSDGHQWSLENNLPQETFEFKVIAVEGGHVRWESGSNRVVQTDEDGDIPVEVVVWLTCHFDHTADTGMQLAVPRANVQDAFETGRAHLEMLKKRRSRMSLETEQVANPVERKRAAAELIRLTEAVVEASTSVHQLGHMLGNAPAAAGSGSASDGEGAAAGAGTGTGAASEDENKVLLMAIDSVRLPKAMRRISFASVVQARGAGGLEAAAGSDADAAATAAGAVSPFLRGELDARAEELMSAAGALLQEMQQQKQQRQQANGHAKPDTAAPASAEWAELAQEAGHVAEALAHLGAPADTQLQLQGLVSVGSALASGNGNGVHLPSHSAALASPPEALEAVGGVANDIDDVADDADETMTSWDDGPVAAPEADAAAAPKKNKGGPLKQLAANLTGALPFKLPFNFGSSPPPAVAASVAAAAPGGYNGTGSTSSGGAARHGIFGTLRTGGVALRPAAARSAAPVGGMNRQPSVATAAAAPAAAGGSVVGFTEAPTHSCASEPTTEVEVSAGNGPAAAQAAVEQPPKPKTSKGRKVRTYKGVHRSSKST